MSSYKCILLVYVKKFSSGHYRIFYRRETVICMGLFDSMKDNMERRQRTREYLKNAKEYINDGEELYQNACKRKLLVDAEGGSGIVKVSEIDKRKICREFIYFNQ